MRTYNHQDERTNMATEISVKTEKPDFKVEEINKDETKENKNDS